MMQCSCTRHDSARGMCDAAAFSSGAQYQRFRDEDFRRYLINASLGAK